MDKDKINEVSKLAHKIEDAAKKIKHCHSMSEIYCCVDNIVGFAGKIDTMLCTESFEQM